MFMNAYKRPQGATLQFFLFIFLYYSSMNLKKFVAGLSAVAVAASNLLGGIAVGQGLNDPEFNTALDWAYTNEMTKYNTESGFMPYANITREQASKFVDVYAMTNLCLSPDAEQNCDFSDIPADASLDEYVMLSCQLGLFKGSNGKFMPTANLTKAQLLAVLVRAIKSAAGEPAVSENATPRWSNYFTEAKALGLTKETNVNALDKPVTRYETLLMMYRARIEDQCSTTSQDITDLLKDLFGEDTGTGSTSTGNVVPTSKGTLDVSLSATTPAGDTVPGLANVVVAEFEVSASTEAVLLNTIELKRYGISNDNAVSRVSLFLEDGTRLTNGKSFNSDDMALLNLSPRLEVGVGKKMKIRVVAEIGSSGAPDNANNQQFQIGINAINDVTTNGKVNGTFPIKGNEFDVGGQDAPELTITPDGTIADVELGKKGAEIASLKLDNNSDDDIDLTHITFTDDEGNIDDAMMNFTLKCDGKLIDSTESATNDFLGFTFSPLTVKQGESVDCNVYADVVANAGDAVALYIDESLDVMGSSDFGYGIAVDVDNYQEANAQVVDILAGELTLVKQKLTYSEVREDQTDVVLGEFKVIINNGQALYIQDISFDLFTDAGTGQLEDIFENFELYDKTNNTRYDLNNTNGTTITLSESNIDLYLPNAGEVTLQVRADTVTQFPGYVPDQTTVHLELDANPANSDLVIKEAEDDQRVMDLVPSFLSFGSIDLVASSVDVTEIPLSDTSVVRGATDVVALQFQVETDEVSSAFLQEISIEGNGNFDSDHVSAVSLYRGTPSGTHTLVESNGGFGINSNSINFDGFDEIEIPVNSTQPFFVTVDVVDDPTIVGDQVQLFVDTSPNPNIDDDNNNDMTVIVNSAGTRLITISNFGTLSCDFDVNDEATDIPSIVLGGDESNYLASFEFNAQNEDIWVRDILVTASPAPNFVDAFEEVVLDDEDGNELYREIITSNAMYLNEIETASGADYIISEGDVNLYVSLVASLIGKNLNGEEAGAFNLSMSVQQAEGISSTDDIATNVSPVNCGGTSQDFMSRAVAISNVDLVSSAGTVSLPSYLSNGVSNKLAIIKVVADTWDNNDPADASSINIVLDTLRVEFENGTEDPVAGVTIKKVGKTTTTTPQAVAAGTNIITFNMTELAGPSDNVIQKGSTVYFVIEGTPVVDDNSESIRINLSDLYGGGNASFVYYGDFVGAATTDAVYLEDSEIDGILLVDNNN